MSQLTDSVLSLLSRNREGYGVIRIAQLLSKPRLDIECAVGFLEMKGLVIIKGTKVCKAQ